MIRYVRFGLLAVTLSLAAGPLHATVNHEETLSNSGVGTASVAVNSVRGGTNQLHLVSVAIYENGINVSGINDGGAGLAWSLQKVQCSARITEARVEIWQAFGSVGGTFNLTVNLTGTASRVSVAVSRYSGADTTTPTEGVSGSNTNGQGAGATCGGGTDNDTPSLSLTSTTDRSVLFVATHPRDRTITTADGDYTERAFVSNDSGTGAAANLYVHDRALVTAGSDSADHTLNNVTDWDMAGLVIRPQPGHITQSNNGGFASGSKFYSHCTNGHYWAAVRDESSTFLFSSPDGETWVSQGEIFSTFYPGFQDWAVRYSGNTLIAFAFNGGDDTRYYSKGTLNSDGTVTWDVAEAAVGGADAAWIELNALIANGKPILWRAGPTNTDAGKFTIGDQLHSPIVWSDTADAPSLGPAVVPGNGTDGSFSAGAIFPTGGSDPNDLIVLRTTAESTHTVGNSRLVAIKYDASAAAFDTEWFNVSTIGGTLTEDSTNEVKTYPTDEDKHRRFAAVQDTNGNIHAVYVTRDQVVAHYRKDAGFNDDWSQVSADVAQASSIAKVGLTALPDGQVLLFYERSNDLYRRRFDGSNWGGERLVYTASDLRNSLGAMEFSGACAPGVAVTKGTVSHYDVSFVVPADLTQSHYRWRNDDGDETGATWAAAEDTKLTGLAKSTTRRLRFAISNEGAGSSGAVKYELQFAQSSSCSSASYSVVPTGATDDWEIVDTTFYTDAQASTNVSPGLTDEGATFVAGELKDDGFSMSIEPGNTTGDITLAADEFTEIEYAVAATTLATDGADYCFRLYDSNAGQVLHSYAAYAEVRLAASPTDLLTLSDHSGGQVVNQFTTDTTTSAVLFTFNLERAGTVTVDELRVQFTTANGVEFTDVSSGQLWRDNNNNRLVDAGDVQIGMDITPTSGELVFSTDFTPDTGPNGTDYLVRATVTSLAANDRTTFSLSTANITTVEGVNEAGSASNVLHQQNGGTPTINYRSIGTNTGILYNAGTASIANGDIRVTLSDACLPENVGKGDKLTLDPGGANEEVLFILSRNGESQFTVQTPAAAAHVGESYQIERAYHALQDWEDDRDGDLVTENRREVGVAYNDGVFTLPVGGNNILGINQSTTDATRYMHLTAADNQWHRGVPGAGVVLDGRGITFHGILILDDYTRVDRLDLKEFHTLDGGGGTSVQVGSGATNVLVENLIIRDFLEPTTQFTYGFRPTNANVTSSTIRNSIIYNGGISGVHLQFPGSSVTVENVTVYNMTGPGIRLQDGTMTVTNSISMGNGNNDFQDDVAGMTQSYNLSEDGTASGTGSLSGMVPEDQFVSIASENFFLKAGADAIDAGTNLSGSFSDDVGGGPRHTGAEWDMGADESSREVNQIHYRWRFDDGTENGGANWAASEDTKLTGLGRGLTRRLRFAVSNKGGVDSGPVTYELQFAQACGCSTASYAPIPTTATDDWQIVDSSFITEPETTANVSPGLTDEATTFVAGELKDAGNTTGGITLASDEFTEIEFAVQPTALATDGASYCFRLVDSSAGQLLDAYSIYAEAQLAEGDATVSASGTQTATMLIPSTDQYVGGKFVIRENTGSRNVTGITITERGTVDAQVDLSNIKLYYELDTTAPYGGSGVSFDGGEAQFGSTVASFDAADGTATFTDSVGITTTATMVVYVVFDVGSGATDGETVEISINNPESQVTVDLGTVEPNTSVGISGTTFLIACAPGTIAIEETIEATIADPLADTSFTLPSWTPGSSELVLLAVSVRDPSVTVSASGNGLTFVEIVDLDNTQGQGAIHLFRAMGASPSTGQIQVSLSAATSAVAKASRFSGVHRLGTNGSGAIEAIVTDAGPNPDNNDVKINVTTLSPEAWAFAAAWHRNDTLQDPPGAGDTSIDLNDPTSGSGGNIVSASLWYEGPVSTPGSVELGAVENLSADRDWALIAVSLKPSQCDAMLLDEHGSGQVGDKFSFTSSVTDVLFAFSLERLGTATVDEVRVQFTEGNGVVWSDVSAAQLWRDNDGDGTVSGGDVQIGSDVTPAGSPELLFTTDFTPDDTTTNYIVRATVDNLSLVDRDETTFSLSNTDITVLEGGVSVSGSASAVTHKQGEPVAIEQGGEDNAEGFQGTGAAVVFVTDQIGYAFYLEDDGNLDANAVTGELKYAKTTDGGATWPTEVSIDPQTDVSGFAIWYDKWTPGSNGSKIHIAFIESLNDDFYYDFLDAFDDSQRPGGAVMIRDLGSVGVNDGKPSITSSTDGDLYAFVAASERDVWTSADAGDTWISTQADKTLYGGFLDHDLDHGNLMPLSGGDILLTYQDCTCVGSTKPILSRVLSDAGTWDSSDLTVTSLFLEDQDFLGMWGTSLFKETGDVYLSLNTRPDGDPLTGEPASIETHLYDESSRTWSQKTDVVTGDLDGLMDTKLAIDECSGDVYALYIRGRAELDGSFGSVDFKVSTDGMTTWGAEVTMSEDPGDFRAVRPNLMSNERLYALWLENNNGLETKIWGDTIVDLPLACTTEVDLVSFSATALDGAVQLEWETGSEIDNLGFHLYRSTEEDGSYERITASVIPGLGSSPEGATYSYVDSGLTNGQEYFYTLEDIETTGASEMHGPVSATPEEGASAGTGEPLPSEGGGSEEAESEGSHPSRITYGSPWENALFLRQINGRTLELELLTRGFYAYPEEDGTVRLVVPGLELFAAPGEPAVPVYRGLVEAVVGLQVDVGRFRVDDVQVFTSLRPSSTEAPAVISSWDGTTRAGKKKVRRKFLRGKGLYPEEPARLVEVVFQGDAKKALVEMSPIRWDEDGGRLLLAKRMTVRVRFRGKEPAERALANGGGRRHLETHEPREVLARFVTTEPGLYGVRFEDVVEKGARPIDTSKLRLSRQGETVAFRVMPGAKKFNRKSVLYFISEGADANPYGHEAVYELELSDAGVIMDKADAEPYGSLLLEYWNTVRREENRLYQAAFVEAEDVWQWDWIFGPMTKSFPFEVANLAASPESSRLEVWLQGASDFPQLDHHARVYVNGTLVAEDWWDGETGVQLTAELLPGVLHEGENVLEIEDVGDTDALYSMIMLDRFEVTYPAQLVAADGELAGSFDQSGTAWVPNLESGYVFDLSGEHPQWLTGVNHADGVGFGTIESHQYLVVDEAAVRSPEVRKPLATSLRSEVNAAEYLVIGPRAFLSAAEPLLRYRLNEGLRPMAVAVEDIYSEFGYGEATAESIREFLSYAYHHWNEPTVRYVVLLGDATYDTKDYLGTGVVNQVPAKLVKTRYVWTASDPWLASVNGGDILPDVAIGRLPAASVEEVQAIVEKILAFETGEADPDASVVLITDNPDVAGDFDGDADDLSAAVFSGRDVEKIRLSELGTAATRGAILNAFDEGPSIVSYIGHGAIHLWANENLFNIGSVDSLSLQSQQPLLFTMNCLNGYFHFPYHNSLSEELLKAEGKGIIAAFSPSGLSLDGPAHRFHTLLLDQVVNAKHKRLGDAILAGQAGYADTGSLPELLIIYHLLGDPALRLR